MRSSTSRELYWTNDCRPLQGTSVLSINIIQDILKEWGLDSLLDKKQVASVTDNGSNVVAAMESFGIDVVRCFAHGLDLVIGVSTQHLGELFDKYITYNGF